MTLAIVMIIFLLWVLLGFITWAIRYDTDYPMLTWIFWPFVLGVELFSECERLFNNIMDWVEERKEK